MEEDPSLGENLAKANILFIFLSTTAHINGQGNNLFINQLINLRHAFQSRDLTMKTLRHGNRFMS